MTTFDNDLCYCHDAACPQKDRCYRYVNRHKAEFASYAATLRDPETGRCEYFQSHAQASEINHLPGFPIYKMARSWVSESIAYPALLQGRVGHRGHGFPTKFPSLRLNPASIAW